MTTRCRFLITFLAFQGRVWLGSPVMRWVSLAVVVVAFGATASTANAATLSKREARAQAKYFVRERANERNWEWATYWQVESAYKCSRRNRLVVECDFDLIDETDVDELGYMWGCADTVRVRETRRNYWASYPAEPDCGYYYSDE